MKVALRISQKESVKRRMTCRRQEARLTPTELRASVFLSKNVLEQEMCLTNPSFTQYSVVPFLVRDVESPQGSFALHRYRFRQERYRLYPRCDGGPDFKNDSGGESE